MGIDFQCVYWVKRSIIEVYRVTQGKTVLSENSIFLLQFELVDLIDECLLIKGMILTYEIFFYGELNYVGTIVDFHWCPLMSLFISSSTIYYILRVKNKSLDNLNGYIICP